MKFLADEDFPKPLVILIRKLGFSVKTIQQKSLQGATDETVANITLREKRVMLTFDKDFLKDQPKDLQVIVFEFPRIPTSAIVPLIETLLKDLRGIKSNKGNILKFNKHGLETVK